MYNDGSNIIEVNDFQYGIKGKLTLAKLGMNRVSWKTTNQQAKRAN